MLFKVNYISLLGTYFLPLAHVLQNWPPWNQNFRNIFQKIWCPNFSSNFCHARL